MPNANLPPLPPLYRIVENPKIDDPRIGWLAICLTQLGMGWFPIDPDDVWIEDDLKEFAFAKPCGIDLADAETLVRKWRDGTITTLTGPGLCSFADQLQALIDKATGYK